MTTKAEKAQKKYEDTIRKLDESDELTDADREVIERFRGVLEQENLNGEGITLGRFAVHLDGLRLMAERTGCLAATLEPGNAGDEAMRSVLKEQTDKERFAGTTIAGRLQSLQLFGRRLAENEDAALRFESLDPASYRDEDPTPLRTNILEWGDVIDMAQTRERVRDKAMLMSQWAAGGRPESEMWTLQFKHIEDKGDHIVLSIPQDGKTGRREVHMFAGAPMFRYWINIAHPAHLECEDGPTSETHVWTLHRTNKHIDYSTYYDVFQKAGKAADLEKDHNPEHFRRSRASILASRIDISEQDLRNHFGWCWSSPTPRHYIARFGGETGRHVALADGADVDVGDDPDPIAPITCTNCGERTTRHLDTCIYCESEITEEDIQREAIVEDPAAEGEDLLDLIMSGKVDGDDIRSLQKLEPVLRTRPDVLDDLEQLEQLAEGYADAEEDEGGAKSMLATGPASIAAYASGVVTNIASKWARAKHTALSLDPSLPHYPPNRPRAAAMIWANIWTVIAAVAILDIFGFLDMVLNGNLFIIGQLVVGLAIGTWKVDKDLPTVDEAASKLMRR